VEGSTLFKMFKVGQEGRRVQKVSFGLNLIL